MTRIVALLAILLTLSTGCSATSGYRYGASTAALPTPTSSSSHKSGGIDGKSVATGVAIGVGVTLVTIVIGGIMIIKSIEDHEPSDSGWDGYCPGPCDY